MNKLIENAEGIRDKIIATRRELHGYAEVGFDMPHTLGLVMARLTELGLSPQRVGRAGISCLVGSGGRTLLLRADMDALPMPEQSGLPFAATGGSCHACGHDAHTAMLLGAAELLAARADELGGTVKLMFQPAEEIMGGALDMLENGILESPTVNAAMALHIAVGADDSQAGRITYAPGPLTYSGDALKIVITGRAAHGSTPHLGVDAVFVAAQVITALHNITTKELPVGEPAVVLVGKVAGGTAVNTVADTAVLDVSLRAKTHDTRTLLTRRVGEVAAAVATAHGATAVTTHLYGMPPLVNDAPLSAEMAGYCAELLGEERVLPRTKFSGSEDFSIIAERVPAVFMSLGVGSVDEGYEHSLHHPAMVINEAALPTGAAVYAYCAVRYLSSC